MAEKIINSRIVLKHDTLANWLESTLVLKNGEVAVASIPTNTANSGLTPPAIGIKVGDGEHTFSELNWIQAIAGDVRAWAKAATKPDYTSTEIKAELTTGDGKTVESRLADLETSAAAVAVYRILTGTGADANKWMLQKKAANADDSAYTTVSTIDLNAILATKQDVVAFDGTYNKDTNKAATVATVTEAIQGLDVDDAAVTGKYVSAVGVNANGELDITRADLPDYTNTYAAKAYEGKVDTLIGSDASKSVRTIANEELAAQLIPAGAKEALDTLQEIAAWIQAHPDDASAMNQKITAIKNALSSFITVGQDGAYTVNTDAVKDYVDNAASAAIEALDVSNITGFGAGKTLATLTETDGIIAATFQDIAILLNQVTDAGTAAAKDYTTTVEEDGTDLPTAGAVYDHVAGVVAGLDSSVAATAADGNKYSVLTGITEVDGKLTAKAEVKLEAIAKTGNVNDLVQTAGDVLVLDCGNAD